MEKTTRYLPILKSRRKINEKMRELEQMKAAAIKEAEGRVTEAEEKLGYLEEQMVVLKKEGKGALTKCSEEWNSRPSALAEKKTREDVAKIKFLERRTSCFLHLARIGAAIRNRKLELDHPVGQRNNDLIKMGNEAAQTGRSRPDALLYKCPHVLGEPREDDDGFEDTYGFGPGDVLENLEIPDFHDIIDWHADLRHHERTVPELQRAGQWPYDIQRFRSKFVKIPRCRETTEGFDWEELREYFANGEGSKSKPEMRKLWLSCEESYKDGGRNQLRREKLPHHPHQINDVEVPEQVGVSSH